ncbi:MAG: hypothetical protein ACOX6U_09920 [Oscillospiraceae bacterium]
MWDSWPKENADSFNARAWRPCLWGGGDRRMLVGLWRAWLSSQRKAEVVAGGCRRQKSCLAVVQPIALLAFW